MFAKKVLGDSIGRNRLWGSQPRRHIHPQMSEGDWQRHELHACDGNRGVVFRFLD
jgi:hypothetical protein